MKGIEWNTHSSLFLPNPKFSFPPKLGGIGGNGFKFRLRLGVYRGMEWNGMNKL